MASAEPVQIQDAHTGKVLTVADPSEQGVKPYLAPWDGGAVCEIFNDGHIKCSDGRVLDVNRHKRRIQDDILVHRPLYFNREVHRNQKWSVRAADGSWRKGCR